MNDRQYRDTKRRIEAVLHKWKPMLGLATWHIEVNFLREGIPQDADQADANFVSYFEIRVQWDYLRAYIDANMPELAALDDDLLRHHLIHELLHCVVREMRYWSPTRQYHEERVVEMLARIIASVELTGWNDAKDDSRNKQREAAKAKE